MFVDAIREGLLDKTADKFMIKMSITWKDMADYDKLKDKYEKYVVRSNTARNVNDRLELRKVFSQQCSAVFAANRRNSSIPEETKKAMAINMNRIIQSPVDKFGRLLSDEVISGTYNNSMIQIVDDIWIGPECFASNLLYFGPDKVAIEGIKAWIDYLKKYNPLKESTYNKGIETEGIEALSLMKTPVEKVVEVWTKQALDSGWNHYIEAWGLTGYSNIVDLLRGKTIFPLVKQKYTVILWCIEDKCCYLINMNYKQIIDFTLNDLKKASKTALKDTLALLKLYQ